MPSSFPLPELAQALLHPAFDRGDGAHEEAHLPRVWRNVERIVAGGGGGIPVLLAASLLHDCVRVDKASPRRAMASRRAAERARSVLGGLGWAEPPVEAVCHALLAHSSSAGIEPASLEARIPQDADRLPLVQRQRWGGCRSPLTASRCAKLVVS